MENIILENQQLSSDKTMWKVGAIIGPYEIVDILGLEKFKVRCIKCKEEFELGRQAIKKAINNDGCRYCKTGGRKMHYPGEQIACYTLIKKIDFNSKWLVKCNKCGREQELHINTLKNRTTDVCYFCLHPNETERPYTKRKNQKCMPIDERIYTYYKGTIENKNKNSSNKYKSFYLTQEEFTNLIYSNCSYCGSEPTEDNMWNKGSKRKNDDTIVKINGIDRIDSNLGYTKENCVPCCPICNRFKSDLSKQSFLSHIYKITNYQKKLNDQSKDVASSDCEMGNTLLKGDDMV